MGSIIALILQFLPYLVQAAAAIPEITTFIASLEAIFKQSAVWTPAQQTAFDAQTTALRSSPQWQIID